MRRGTLFGALIGTLAACSAAPALADQTAPNWNCRASVLQVFGTTAEPRLEPLVANGDGTTGADRATCADDNAGLPVLDSPDGSLHVETVAAATRIAPVPGAARDQTVRSAATLSNAQFSTPGGELTISARLINAGAEARCVNGAPAFDGSSTVADLEVNGQKLPIDDSVLSEITQQVNDSPLGGAIKVLVNQKIVTPDGLTVQAVRIELFSAAGAPQGTVVIGEAKVSKAGDTCAPASTTTTGGSTGTNGTNGTNGTAGANGTNGTSTTTTSPATSGSGASTTKVIINGQNGGCGRIKVWFEKVDLLHRLPGKPMKATSRFGQRVMIRGQLISCSGKPIIGGRLDQLHFVGKGVGRLVKTGVKTRSAGKFTYIEPLNLTTRRIVFRYRGNLASGKVTSRKVLRLTVRGKHGQVIKGHPPATLE